MKSLFKFLFYAVLIILWIMFSVASAEYGNSFIATFFGAANFFLPFLLFGYFIYKAFKPSKKH